MGFNGVYTKSSTAEISVSEFCKCGICPCNKNTFSEWPPPDITSYSPKKYVDWRTKKTKWTSTIKTGKTTKRAWGAEKKFVGTENTSPLPCHSGTSGSKEGKKPRENSSYIITCMPFKDLEESMREQERKKSLKEEGRKPKQFWINRVIAMIHQILEVSQWRMTIRIWTLTMRMQNVCFVTVYTLKMQKMASSGYVAWSALSGAIKNLRHSVRN